MLFVPTSRRMFLRTACGGIVAAPFLPSLLPRSLRSAADAQTKADRHTVPRRFVAIKTYSGMPVLDWLPRNAPQQYRRHSEDGTVALKRPLPSPTGRHKNGQPYSGHDAPLSDFRTFGVSRILSKKLNPHLDTMLLFRGLDFMPGLNHNHGGYLGNLGINTDATGGPFPGAQINTTIDYVIAASRAVYPEPPIGPRVLHLGGRRNTASYAPRGPLLATGLDAVEQAQAYTDPQSAFNAALGTVMPMLTRGRPEVGGSLLNGAIEDYRRVRANPQLGRDDRRLLERHLNFLSELEHRIARAAHRTCGNQSAPKSVDAGEEFNVDVDQITALFEGFVDVILMAFQCDVTRVVTLDVSKMVVRDRHAAFGMGDSEAADSAGRDNWHFQAHEWDDNAKRWLALGAQWIAEQVVLRLLNGLSEVNEADGNTMLHHSLVVWGNEVSFNHLNYSVPTATWGRAGGVLNTGRYIDYVDHDQPVRFRQHDGSVIEGVQYNRFLVTLMQAMGLTEKEYERNPGRGFGETRPLEKGPGFATDYDHTNVGQTLPSLLL